MKIQNQDRKQHHCAAPALADVTALNTLIPNTHNKNHVIEDVVSERIHNKFGNSRGETHARKSLQKENTKPGFTMRKPVYRWLKFHRFLRLHMAEVSYAVILKFDCFCVSFELFRAIGKFVVRLLCIGIIRFDVLDVHQTTK